MCNNFNRTLHELGFTDTWRTLHNDQKMHTWRRNSIARRLDYLFTDDTLMPFLQSSEIVNLGFSDHLACIAHWKFNTFKRGSSYYKMNTDILKDINYINMTRYR